MGGSRLGVPHRPTEEREAVFQLVLSLRAQGRSYNQIIEGVREKTGVRLSKSHLSDWINGKHNRLGSVRAFNAKPTPELSYVVAVKLGDASMSISSNNNYMIKLRVKDRDFAEEFSRCLSVVLGRSPPKVKWHEKTQMWHTQVSSLLLHRLLAQPVVKLRFLVDYDDACRAKFLRGFFDSEGSASGRSLKASNGDLDKLKLVRDMLLRAGIQVYGPHLASLAGGMVVIKGKMWRRNKNQYYVNVATDSLERFRERVGFSIGRKTNSLNKAVGR